MGTAQTRALGALFCAHFALVGTYPFPVSDHRLVWIDVQVGAAPK